MKKSLLKRWSIGLLVFILWSNVTPLTFAMEVETETSATSETNLSEENNDEVSSTATEESTLEDLNEALEEGENDDQTINHFINELLKKSDDSNSTENLLKKVRREIEGRQGMMLNGKKRGEKNSMMTGDNEDEMKNRDFLMKLRAKAIMQDSELAKKLLHGKEGRHLFQVRWGILQGNEKPRCPELSEEEIRSKLEAEESLECEGIKEITYKGSLSVNKGSLTIKNPVLFEKGDEVTTESGSSIEWTSKINGHWDGLLVEYTPSDEEGEVQVTLKIGDLNTTFTPGKGLTPQAIGNGNFVEFKGLARSLDGVPSNVETKLFENKAKLQERMAKIKDRLKTIQWIKPAEESDVSDESEKLEEVLDSIEAYNFDQSSNTEISTEVDAALSNLDENASSQEIEETALKLKQRYEMIRKMAKERKFKEKLIPFKDTDDDQWFTKFVASVKEREIVGGFKDSAGNEIGEYRPGNRVTVGEILKIGLKTSSQEESAGTPKLGKALGHWAKGFVKRAEELKLDLVSDPGTDLDRPATRGEVIRMMLQAAGLKPETISKTSFSDLPKDHEHAAWIELAAKLGIISGDDKAKTFRPDDTINRAEVAKISDQVSNIVNTEE